MWEIKKKCGGGIKHFSSFSKKEDRHSRQNREITNIKRSSPYLKKYKPDTLNSIDKSSYTPRTNLSNKITGIKKPTEIDILKDNDNVSFLENNMI